MRYLANAFSINMLSRQDGGRDFSIVPITTQAARNILNHEPWQSAIGHEDTAHVIGNILGMDVPANRINVKLSPPFEHSLLVAQYTGPRLETGATELPEGAEITFWQVYDH